MRSLFFALVSVVVSLFASGCGQCTAICINTALISAVDSAGAPLTIQSITENTGLAPTSGCGVNHVVNTSPAQVTSACTRFAVDVVATDGKRFSGVLDVADGSTTAPVCGSVCRNKSFTLTLQ